MTDSQITFDSLCKSILIKNEHFPVGKLVNRLVNIGIKDLIDGNKSNSFGLPFKYVDHLDESTLALAYFVNRFRKEGGSLKIHGSHRLQKGEDKTLSPWINERARLFLELQNILFLMNGVDGREVEIKRVFILRDISDVAFFNQSAISVLSEQVSLGIEVGFLFLNDFGESRRDSAELRHILSSSFTIEYTPAEPLASETENNFYFQGDTIRERSLRNNIPYLRGCLVKWARDWDHANSIENNPDFTPEDLGRHRQLFQNWKDFDKENFKTEAVLRIFNENEKRFSNDALLMQFSALHFSKSSPDYDPKPFIDRIFDNVITRDLVRLEKAMNAFDNDSVKAIRAVDATSVKTTLNLHESDPTYRQWLRRSINRVLTDRSGETTIKRIYIIDDLHEKKNEDATLIRNLQYYLDFLAFEVEEISAVSSKDGAIDFEISNDPLPWIEANWNNLRGRIRIFVTTTKNLEKYAKAFRTPESLRALRQFTGKNVSEPTFARDLSHLDYLFTEAMIYDFNNERGDPSELTFDAFLLRKNFDVEKEIDENFDFPGMHRLFGSKKYVRLLRIKGFAKAIKDYWDNYSHISKETKDTISDGLTREDLDSILSLDPLTTDIAELSRHEQSLTGYRSQYETCLYEFLHPKAKLLFATLEDLSLEINLFDGFRCTSITEIPPFNQKSFNIETLTAEVGREIEKNITIKETVAKVGPIDVPPSPTTRNVSVKKNVQKGKENQGWIDQKNIKDKG